jgi:hypothetical protein
MRLFIFYLDPEILKNLLNPHNMILYQFIYLTFYSQINFSAHLKYYLRFLKKKKFNYNKHNF